MTRLEAATRHESLLIVRKLLQAGAEVSSFADDYDGALRIAIVEGQLDVLDALLDAGVDVNLRDGHGETALEVASSEGNLLIVQKIASGRRRSQHQSTLPINSFEERSDRRQDRHC
jgi:uncharacterized protein